MTRDDVLAVQLMIRALPERISVLPGEAEVLAELDEWFEARIDQLATKPMPEQPLLALGAAGPRP